MILPSSYTNLALHALFDPFTFGPTHGLSRRYDIAKRCGCPSFRAAPIMRRRDSRRALQERRTLTIIAIAARMTSSRELTLEEQFATALSPRNRAELARIERETRLAPAATGTFFNKLGKVKKSSISRCSHRVVLSPATTSMASLGPVNPSSRMVRKLSAADPITHPRPRPHPRHHQIVEVVTPTSIDSSPGDLIRGMDLLTLHQDQVVQEPLTQEKTLYLQLEALYLGH